MKTHNLILIGIILLSTILSTLSYFVLTNDFTPNKDELVSEADIISSKKTYPTINKALSLDTTTNFTGEDIRVRFDNATSLLWVPSTYRYNSINNITHFVSVQVTIPLRRAHDDMEIYAPDHWNLSSLTPDDDTPVYNPSDNDYSITLTHGPGAVTYLWTFLSGDGYGRLKKIYNNYLTIDDNSDNYLSDNGFESGFSDWSNSSFDSVELNSTVTYAGTNSIMLTNTDASEDIFTLNQSLDLRGDYYISVPIYVDGTMGVNTGVVLQYYDGGWNNRTVSGNLNYTDRWQPNRFFIHPTSEESNIEFRIIFKGSGQILIDEFQIWEVNSKILPNSIISNYNISSSLISWDSRENFGVNNERVDYNITLTNTGANQNSTSITTDSNGFSSYIYVNKTLDEAQLTISTNSAYYFPYNTFSNLQENEVLRTDMNDGSTLFLNDLSGNGFRGTINDSTWISSPVQGNALDFERDEGSNFVDFGDEDEFSFTDGADDDLPMSFSFWLKLEDVVSGGTQGIISKDRQAPTRREWAILTAGGKLEIEIFDQSTGGFIARTTSSILTVNVLYHFVITYSGSNTMDGIKFWLNGTEPSTTNRTVGAFIGMENTAAELTFANSFSANYLDGIIDEVRIYNKELSQSEINYLFQPDQDFQCQPRQIDERPFNYETKSDGSLNEWNFKEGTSDNYINILGTITNNSGYLQLEHTTNTGIRTNSTINADIYNSLELRVISNVSVGLQIQNYDSSTNFSTVQSITTSYQILSIILTDWSGTQPSLRLQISGSNYQVRIDYIRLIRPITTVITSNDPFWIINSLDDSFSYVFNITYAGDIIRTGTVVDNVRQVSKQNGNTVINAIAIQDTSYPNECLLPCDLVTKTITTKGVEMMDEPQYWVNIISMLILLIVIFIGIAMFKLYWRTVK